MNIRIALLGTAVALAPALSLAADLPGRKAPVAVAMPTFSWTGAYLGLNAGYGQFTSARSYSGLGAGTYTIFTSAGTSTGSITGSQRQNAGGVLGGLQAGYNRQFDSIVLGVEADISAANMRSHSQATGGAVYSSRSGSGVGTSALDTSSRLSGIGTLRGRFGVAIDRALIYATGGLAYAKVENSIGFAVNTQPWSGAAGATQDKWKLGWTAGAGVEYAMTNNWSVKGEALYFDLGRTNLASIVSNPSGTTGVTGSFRNTGVIGRIGVNYRY